MDGSLSLQPCSHMGLMGLPMGKVEVIYVTLYYSFLFINFVQMRITLSLYYVKVLHCHSQSGCQSCCILGHLLGTLLNLLMHEYLQIEKAIGFKFGAQVEYILGYNSL